MEKPTSKEFNLIPTKETSPEIETERFHMHDRVVEAVAIGNTFSINGLDVKSVPATTCLKKCPRVIGIIYNLMEGSVEVEYLSREFIKILNSQNISEDDFSVDPKIEDLLFQLSNKKWQLKHIKTLTTHQALSLCLVQFSRSEKFHELDSDIPEVNTLKNIIINLNLS